jgi:hypothetical protein
MRFAMKSLTHLQLEASVALLDGHPPKAKPSFEQMRRSAHVFRLCDADARFILGEVMRFAWKTARKHASEAGGKARDWFAMSLSYAWETARQQVGDTRMLIEQAAYQDGRVS